EVNEDVVNIWRNLPHIVRKDPSLAIIRKEHEKLHGQLEEQDPLPDDVQNSKNNLKGQLLEEQDPLPNEVQDSENNHDELTNIDVRCNSTDTKPLDSEMITSNGSSVHKRKRHPKLVKWYHRIKIACLVLVWIFFTYLLMTFDEKELEHRQTVVLPFENKDFVLHETPLGTRIGIYLKGAFYENLDGNASNFLNVYIELLDGHNGDGHIENITMIHSTPIVYSQEIDHVEESNREIVFDIGDEALVKVRNEEAVLRVQMYTNIDKALPLLFAYDPSPINKDVSVICAAIVLLGLYVLIVFDVVHRTFAAILASTLALSVLAVMHQKPTMEEVIAWIDVETLLLLFGMMILVAILSETGIFDFLAVFAYKVTKGRVWPLINCLALFTAILSAFLDNVTTILLMTPVTIRLSEVMGLNPVPILMTMVIYSNVGGALTPVGDPPNVIITSNPFVIESGINFLNFTAHMGTGIIFVMLQTYVQIRLKYRKMNDLRFGEPKGIQELRHELGVWQRSADSLSSYSKDEILVRETLLKKVQYLEKLLKKRLATGKLPTDTYKETLQELQSKYFIRNKKLLIKSIVALIFTITFFFLHAAPHIQRLSIGWTALLGAVLLLILADREDIESVVARVEWTTLLFFAALFVLMEALGELGLIEWIGNQTENIIFSVSVDARLAVAILIILWVSAFASAFVDNIPLTTMMLKIVISIAQNRELGLPFQPLIWALAFGACLGGNGTLIGASANLVCAGLAQQHGYKFTFMDFFKVGFPIMLGHTIVSTAYLMIAHVLFSWH
ncbi:P protein, partial [Pseudolycoriella hygida]